MVGENVHAVTIAAKINLDYMANMVRPYTSMHRELKVLCQLVTELMAFCIFFSVCADLGCQNIMRVYCRILKAVADKTVWYVRFSPQDQRK